MTGNMTFDTEKRIIILGWVGHINWKPHRHRKQTNPTTCVCMQYIHYNLKIHLLLSISYGNILSRDNYIYKFFVKTTRTME